MRLLMLYVDYPLADKEVERGQADRGVIYRTIVAPLEDITERCARQRMREAVVNSPKESLDCALVPWLPSWREMDRDPECETHLL